MKYLSLIILGFLWSARLTAIKIANLSGNDIHVTIILAIQGTATIFLFYALFKNHWPPFTSETIRFYIISGLFGFILPFIFENITAPNLPVFVLVVIVSTMPILTLLFNILSGNEKTDFRQMTAIVLGFLAAMMIVYDTSAAQNSDINSWFWVVLAFVIPALYAFNTVFVASKWPKNIDAIHVAFAQSLIISIAAIPYMFYSRMIAVIPIPFSSAAPIVAIAVFEALAILVYLDTARRFGATFVSMANYVSMVFAALIGAFLFKDSLTWVTLAATIILVASLTLNQSKKRH